MIWETIKRETKLPSDKIPLFLVDKRTQFSVYNNIKWTVDMFADNVNATWFTFQTLPERRKLVWVVSGDTLHPEQIDYSCLESIVKERVEVIIVAGTRLNYFRDLFSRICDLIILVEDIQTEIAYVANLYAKRMDLDVLISPAHSTYDAVDNQKLMIKAIESVCYR